MTITFRSRSIGNEPIVTIEAHDVPHLMSSRYFKIYTFDSQVELSVSEQEGTVKILSRKDLNASGIVIGYIS